MVTGCQGNTICFMVTWQIGNTTYHKVMGRLCGTIFQLCYPIIRSESILQHCPTLPLPYIIQCCPNLQSPYVLQCQPSQHFIVTLTNSLVCNASSFLIGLLSSCSSFFLSIQQFLWQRIPKVLQRKSPHFVGPREIPNPKIIQYIPRQRSSTFF